MKKILIVCLILSSSLMTIAQEGRVRKFKESSVEPIKAFDNKYSFYVEGGGVGALFSLNIDRRFTFSKYNKANGMTVSLGYTAWPGLDGWVVNTKLLYSKLINTHNL